MPRKLTADFIYPVDQAPIEKGVVVIDDEGKILSLDTRDNHDPASLEKLEGSIIPGFINAHCHLELSHMKGKIDTGTGLLEFIRNVVSYRDIAEEEIMDAIAKADQEMLENGIVAVGDISNKADTFAQKAKSKIQYYTFVEMFDFMQTHLAKQTFDQYKAVYDQHPAGHGNQFSAVPHAPYSVTKELFAKINELNAGKGTVSIHNQETPAEQDLFLHKGRGFIDLFGAFGMSYDKFEPTGKTAIHYALENLDPKCKTLFVHNTLTSSEDIHAAKSWNEHIFWASCPNANLYIENRLPDYQFFLDADAQVCLGTDSLSSNWQLSILEEMKTIRRYKSYVPFEKILEWATLNGAKVLSLDHKLGSITVGKTPGLSLISIKNTIDFSYNTTVRKII